MKKSKAKKQHEAAVESAFYRVFREVPIPILELSRVSDAISAALLSGSVPDTDPAVLALREHYLAKSGRT